MNQEELDPDYDYPYDIIPSTRTPEEEYRPPKHTAEELKRASDVGRSIHEKMQAKLAEKEARREQRGRSPPAEPNVTSTSRVHPESHVVPFKDNDDEPELMSVMRVQGDSSQEMNAFSPIHTALSHTATPARGQVSNLQSSPAQGPSFQDGEHTEERKRRKTKHKKQSKQEEEQPDNRHRRRKSSKKRKTQIGDL